MNQGSNCKTKSERGASMVEFALLIALLALVCVVVLQGVGYAVESTTIKAYDALAGEIEIGYH